MGTAQLARGVRPFYTVTIDGRRVLLYTAVGICIVLAVAILAQPEHAAAAGKSGRTAKFIGREIARSDLGIKVIHKAHLILRNGHDIARAPGGKVISRYQYTRLYPKHGVPVSPSDFRDALREYLRIYGDFGRGVLRIIKHIGHARLSGQFPFVPPDVPGPGAGSSIPM